MTYDRYANLTGIASAKCSTPGLILSVNTNNQITNSGFTYDSAGDLTADGLYSYGWNAEAHQTSGNGVTYGYDGDLKRVKKSGGTLYWYCATCGNVLAESDLSGNIISEYGLFNGQKIARRDASSGNVYYIFRDRLGSYRTLTDSGGNVKGESDYYPFGGERTVNTTVTDSFRFTGMEWDSEDGLGHTLYRQYTAAQGRWETPDPVRGCVSHPQGQNLYAYVRDNPASAADPSGLWEENADCDDFFYALTHAECEHIPELDGEGGGGGGTGGFAPSPGPQQPSCDPCSNPNCPGVCMTPVPSEPSSGTGQCTAWYSGEGQAGFFGDLCKDHADHPVLQYSWQCSGNTNCCKGKADDASKYCYKPHEGIFWVSEVGRTGKSLSPRYANCCGKRKNQIYPPVTPGKPY